MHLEAEINRFEVVLIEIWCNNTVVEEKEEKNSVYSITALPATIYVTLPLSTLVANSSPPDPSSDPCLDPTLFVTPTVPKRPEMTFHLPDIPYVGCQPHTRAIPVRRPWPWPALNE